jgi:isoleucyl-tRNA synthetase
MGALDQYILRRTAVVDRQVLDWYEQFAFHKIYQSIIAFCVVDLSAFYFDILKDRLYTSAPKSRGRRAAQTALWVIGEALVRLLAPIMSFTAEEVWRSLPVVEDRTESVHLDKFWTRVQVAGNLFGVPEWQKLDQEWETLHTVRDQVLKELEAARNNKLIGSGLEAQVTVSAADSVYSALSKYKDQLRYLFIVSAVTLEQVPSGNGAGALKVQVSKAVGQKCERCWNYSTHVGEDPVYPTVCERCSAALKEIEAAMAGTESK